MMPSPSARRGTKRLPFGSFLGMLSPSPSDARNFWRSRPLRKSYHCELWKNLAEREGFEPSVQFPVHTLSKRAPSTTRPPLLWENTPRAQPIQAARRRARARPSPSLPCPLRHSLPGSAVGRPRWGGFPTRGRFAIGQLPRWRRTAAVANRRAGYKPAPHHAGDSTFSRPGSLRAGSPLASPLTRSWRLPGGSSLPAPGRRARCSRWHGRLPAGSPAGPWTCASRRSAAARHSRRRI